LIEFESTASIPIGTINIEIATLMNPESVATTGNIVVTSLMKYDADAKYSKIDIYNGPSNYKALVGTIDSADMNLVSVTQNFFTAARDQTYKLSLKTKHKVYKDGFIKVIIPEAFRISSESSAMAYFSVIKDN